ncbi:hypothetical protein [Qipengyuania atrilutea]|uniref:Uncharacterized protein n=1 Tax=Qipengyuania atrilutea TaxID=2744473 RepID=A0A850H1F8_9SPHN|nr:hypothetical protein [Actirhodobacter atriluteus]NVD45781.1 hypothetical protein [Actirhodobacter atriluteus]
MDETMQTGGRSRNWKLLAPWIAIAVVLTMPFIAMQFDNGVHWTASDFIIMGLLMAFFVGTFQLVARMKFARGKVWIIGGGMLLLFLYIWAELAVGIFNIPGISGS